MPILLSILSHCLFQFHKGSIQTFFRLSPLAVPTLFQFHKGSIQTYSRCGVLGVDHSFQFHKGSIQTIPSVSKHTPYVISIP